MGTRLNIYTICKTKIHQDANLLYRKRTDFGAECVQLWIRSAEPPGSCDLRYGNWNNNNRVYQLLPLPIISSINLQKTWTDKNDLDIFVKSDQEFTIKQAVYRAWHPGWDDLHTHRKNGKIVLMYRIVNHLIEIPASTILQPVGASWTRGHNHHPKSAAIWFFQGTQERRNSRGKRVISVRATEVLL